MKKIFLILILFFITFTNCKANLSVRVKFLITNDLGDKFDRLEFGADSNSTDGFDYDLGERDLPQMIPPSGIHAVFHIVGTNDTLYWSYVDLKPIDKDQKFTIKTYNFEVQNTYGLKYKLEWSPLSNFIDSAFIVDNILGDIVVINMKDSLSAVIENGYIRRFIITVKYRNPNMDIDNEPADNQDILIMPEICDDILNLTAFYMGDFKICNLNAQILKSDKIQLGNNKISISDLPSGIYYFIFKSLNGEYLNKKFLIVH